MNIFDNCENILDILSAYIDNELPEDELQAVDRHLASCKNCRDELALLQGLSDKIKASLLIENFEMPDLSNSVLTRFQEQQNLSCKEVSEELSAYFDAELPPANYYSIEYHLDNCSQCQQKFQQLQYLRNLIKLSVNSLDIDLWQKVYARLISPEELQCSFVADQLSAYLDKEVDAQLAKSISEHIMACNHCRKQFEEFKFIQQQVKKALLLPFKNVDLWPAVRYRLNKQTRAKTFIYSAAASFLMIFLAWNVLSLMFPFNNFADHNYSVATSMTDDSKNTSDNALEAIADESGPGTDTLATSDGYLFSNTFEPPPSGVLPIIYQEENYGNYGF